MLKYKKGSAHTQAGFAPVLILGVVVVASVALYFIYKNFGVSNLNLNIPYSSPNPSTSPYPSSSTSPSQDKEIYKAKDGSWVLVGTNEKQRGAGNQYDYVLKYTTGEKVNISSLIMSDMKFKNQYSSSGDVFITFSLRSTQDDLKFDVANGYEIVGTSLWNYNLSSGTVTFAEKSI